MTRPPALLLVAHGSRDPRHAETVRAVADRVRRHAGPAVRVEPAFLELSPPSVEAAVDGLVADGVRDVTAVPLLLGNAYHAKTDLPGLLCAAAVRHPRTVFRQTAVLGPSPLLQRALRWRLAEAGVRPGDAGTGVVLGWAGSTDPAAVAAVSRLADDLSGYAGPVVPAAASRAAETVPAAVAALRAAGASRVALARYVLAPGRLPDRLVREFGTAGTVAEVLGDIPEVARLVLSRFREASETAGPRALVGSGVP